MSADARYANFLDSPSGKQWRRLGARRRAGVAVPLFSLHSRRTAGVGEFRDLVPLAGWCQSVGLGLIQLLPLNDVGFTFRPYDAESSFALDPMHVSAEELAAGNPSLAAEAEKLRAAFPVLELFDTRVKRAKLEFLRRAFTETHGAGDAGFRAFAETHKDWLRPYSLYRALKEAHGFASWENWPEEARDFSHARSLEPQFENEIAFHSWTQWVLWKQLSQAKKGCAKQSVALMGDLPFLVSRDSADVWANPQYFKRHLAAGAPPDLCFAGGQRWGMPPYDWEAIAADGYGYLKRRLAYAENFYDLFRIDHFVGLFRLWSFPEGSNQGFFDPSDESRWEEHGRKILEAMLSATDMLPCAEDLGTVPDCSPRLLERFAVPGMDVQRWTRHWDRNEFKRPEEYRANSVATAATHDLPPLKAWWEFEAGTVDAGVFEARCREAGLDVGFARERVVDTARSAHGRVRWRAELADEAAFAAALDRRPEDVGGLSSLFRETHDERRKFWTAIGLAGAPEDRATPRFIEAALCALGKSSAVFVSHLFQDWLALGHALDSKDAWSWRINFPGTTADDNWRITLPFPVEDIGRAGVDEAILRMNRKTGRA